MLVILFNLLGCSKAPESNRSLNVNSSTNSIKDSLPGINSYDTISLATLAAILYGRDQYKEAIEAYSNLLLIDSLNGQYYFRKAFCLMQIDQDQNALNLFLKAADLGFERYDVYKNIGLIYCKNTLNNPEEAKKYFEMCLTINPNDELVKELLNSLKEKHNSPTQRTIL